MVSRTQRLSSQNASSSVLIQGLEAYNKQLPAEPTGNTAPDATAKVAIYTLSPVGQGRISPTVCRRARSRAGCSSQGWNSNVY